MHPYQRIAKKTVTIQNQTKNATSTDTVSRSINSSFFVEATGGSFFLRVNEGKAFQDLIYERDLLERLEQRRDRLGDVVTPLMLRNAIGGAFFPVEDAKYACLFGRLEGREVCLCWRLGEDSISHWHELESGFRGRQPIEAGQQFEGGEGVGRNGALSP